MENEHQQDGNNKGPCSSSSPLEGVAPKACGASTTTEESALPSPPPSNGQEQEPDDDKNDSHSFGNGDDSLLDDAHERDLSKFSVSLPDLDDNSMNAVFTYLEYYEQDVAWSIASDFCFVVGGICYVILAVWDERIRLAQGDLEGTDLEAGIEEATEASHWYPILDAMAPAVFCFNSWIDLRWAFVVQERLKTKRNLAHWWDSEWAETSTTTMTPASPYYATRDDGNGAMDHAPGRSSMFTFLDDETWCSRWHHCRKHAAHRRSLWAALTFGGAALLAFVAVFLSSDSDYTASPTQLELASAHLYVASAVICLTGKRTRPWFQSSITKSAEYVDHDCNVNKNRMHQLGLLASIWRNPEILEDMGDALFLIGSVLDASLKDFDAAVIEESALMGIVASCLWLLDALLYMRSDYVRARQHGRIERLGQEIQTRGEDPVACFV